MSDEIGGVCIVTQPQRNRTSKAHAHDLADIITEITTVAVLTANLPGGSTLRDEHEVVEFSSKGTGEHFVVEALRFALNQLRLCKAVYHRNEDVILFFGTTSYVLPVMFSRLLGRTVAVLPRGDVPLSLRLRWEDSLPDFVARVLAGAVSLLEHVNYRLADAVITYTPAMADQLELKRYEKKLYTNGARFVDTDQFDIQIPYENRSRVVGFVGRLDVEKRVPELAAAARRLPEDVQFVFVGDGDYREMLERELSAEIKHGLVEIVGQVDREDVPAQLNRLRLLVVPSHPTEGLPTVILEGMACGTPTYATPVAGVPDIVLEGETGFLIDEVNEMQLTAGIKSILEREDLDRISRTGRELVVDEYSFDAAVERYRDILTGIHQKTTSS